jgi:dihydroneopterin aldolase
MGDGGDVIELRGLRASGYCGLLPEERERAQPLEVDVDIHCDLAEAGTGDDLGATVDYGAICTALETVVTTVHVDLLERLAHLLAETVLGHRRVQGVTVAVRKLRPPVSQQLDTAGVRIHRTRR